MEKGVVLLSGGIDSTVCAAMAAEELGPENVVPVSFAYWQKHDKEILHAIQIAKRLKLGKGTVELIQIPRALYARSSSVLTDPAHVVPKTSYEEVAAHEGVSPMYVPFRNGVMLSMTAAFALSIGASVIYYGAHSEDARNWAYPDCTPEFNGSMASAIYIGTYHEVRLLTPLQWMCKAAIVKTGLEMGVPFELTYSCYSGREAHCGECATCVSRINAFKVIKAVDPVDYEIDIDWPSTGIDLSHLSFNKE